MSNPSRPVPPTRVALGDPRSTGAPTKLRPNDMLGLRGTKTR
jgi:hypothetical protein